jgi:prefoldin subunit 5
MCEYAGSNYRNFLTREEKIELLKEHKESLEKEIKGIGERIKELGENN